MKRLWILWLAGVLTSSAQAQEPPVLVPAPAQTVQVQSAPVVSFEPSQGSGGSLSGNHRFDNFIGFMSNPIMNIDPRAMTSLWPIFSSTSFSSSAALPSGDMQLYGAGLYVALSDKFSFGLTQGGYAVADFQRGQGGPFRDRFGKLRDRREFEGNREGWLDFGGFFQYTLIENVEDQFLLTGGLRWQAPTGSQSLFQGTGPVHLSPYATIAKGFCDFHILATTGFQFPTVAGDDTTSIFYANIHFDYQTFGWLYPLVEFNYSNLTSSHDLSLPTRQGFINQGNFSTTGNVLSMAIGANAVIIPGKLEFGAVYTTPLATQRNVDFDGFLAKMVYRF